MRDAISLLDLCLSDSGEITADTVRECTGLADRGYLFEIMKAAIDEDGPRCLEILGSLWEKSIDYQRFCEQLIDSYRNLMIVRSTGNPAELIACLPDELEFYRELAERYSMERIFYSLSILEDTALAMSRTSQRRAALEMGLLKLSNPALGSTPAAMMIRLEKLEAAIARGVVSTSSPAAVQLAPTQKLLQKEDPDGPVIVTDPTVPVEEFAEWAQVLNALMDKNRALYGTLVNSKAYTADGGLLLVDAGDGLFSQMVRSDSYARKSLRDAALKVTGKTFRLGPYQPEKYEVKQQSATIDKMLEDAPSLGLEVQVSE